ncbi:MAG: efflux RND transporter periplasmic adaptor subunit [Gammaproteobacteria bacterium]
MNATHLSASFIFGLVLAASAAGATGTAGTVAVELRPFAAEYRAYAQVEPRTVLSIHAATIGEVTALMAAPGQHVKTGERLAHIAGPEYDAELTATEARFHTAQVGLNTTQHNYPTFSSARDVTNAQAVLKEARAALTRIKAAGEIRAPVAGTVLSLTVSPGERVSAGTPLLRLLPDNNLWLRATLYAPDAGRIRVGMVGHFYPADDDLAIPIRVRAVIPPLAASGGMRIACVAIRPATWQDGEAGTVVIASGPATPQPVVPTAALILDQGKWWVLISDAHGLSRQVVEIGPSAGEWTFIHQGVQAGERVVAVNAYLRFHADISRHYAPPD